MDIDQLAGPAYAAIVIGGLIADAFATDSANRGIPLRVARRAIRITIRRRPAGRNTHRAS